MTSDGSIVPYEAGSGYSEITGGRKRRKSGKRRRSGKRSSRKSRKSRKYMKKMYRGGNANDPEPQVDEEAEPEAEPEAESESSGATGGRRKRKGKTRKGKASTWITHVKNFSKANKMDFRDALKNPKCKAEYHRMK